MKKKKEATFFSPPKTGLSSLPKTHILTPSLFLSLSVSKLISPHFTNPVPPNVFCITQDIHSTSMKAKIPLLKTAFPTNQLMNNE